MIEVPPNTGFEANKSLPYSTVHLSSASSLSIPIVQVAGVKSRRAVLAHAIPIAATGSVECPARHMGSDREPRFPYMSVAASVVVMDYKGRVLLTRRRPYMRSFPSAWVVPGLCAVTAMVLVFLCLYEICEGGGVEDTETLAEAGAREVLEETGLTVDPLQMSVLGIW